MTEILTKVVINCADGTESIVPLTEEELAQRELDRIAYEEAEAARVAEEDRINTLKTSARAKLVAGEPLTEEEASVLVI